MLSPFDLTYGTGRDALRISKDGPALSKLLNDQGGRGQVVEALLGTEDEEEWTRNGLCRLAHPCSDWFMLLAQMKADRLSITYIALITFV